MRSFKFFHGLTNKLRVEWRAEPIDDSPTLDIVEELSRTLSEEIDNEIINELTRRINGGGQPSVFEGEIQRFNTNIDYFNRWMGIGENRA